ncbi:hypothetical protein ABIB86_000476 [Bradyrhizobium sp. JR1.7]|uniref:hypothetical protein n=1 Tax=Bradyrhizobium sp. JR1.7 TaxID=3156368 RepID=UPI00339872AC
MKYLAGVAGQPQPNDFNGCDTAGADNGPAESPANQGQCRTFRRPGPDDYLGHERREIIDQRLGAALIEAGNSALGMPGTVDTFKAMLDKAGLALVLR